MQRYHKIENLFKRHSGKLAEGEFQEKHVKLLKENQWLFSEKVDGVNIRLHWSGEEMTLLGRNNNSQIPPHLLEYLQGLFKKEEIAKHVYPGCILVGEGYGERIEEPREANIRQMVWVLSYLMLWQWMASIVIAMWWSSLLKTSSSR